MTLGPAVRLRHELHCDPELSGAETRTAERIVRFFEPLRADEVLMGLGGHGLAFLFGSAASGPTVLLRCELDALPISEDLPASYRTRSPGISHKCGHDGHMAILAAVGESLARQRPRRGRVVLLFQPAEETGAGAAAVLADPRWQGIRPDFAFALHNVPGVPLGEIRIKAGTISCASRGMEVRLTGRTAHAAQPETGISPAHAMCRLIGELEDLHTRLGPGAELAFATVVGASLGKKAFGTAPGEARVWATLRSEADSTMERMVRLWEKRVRDIAAADSLAHAIEHQDVFRSTENGARAVAMVRRARGTMPLQELDAPFRWSEDFGRFTALFEGALFAVGAGEDAADLHDPAYDFPDELIEIGSALFLRIIGECLAA